MAVEANQEWLKSNGEPHQVLVHRLPSFNFQLKDILQPHFHLLDPAGSPEPAGSFLSSHAQSVRALICVANTPLTAETLNLLPSLELVLASSAGVDHIDTQECRRRGIILTNASAAFAEDAADYAVTLLIDVWRRISAADRFLHAGLWPVKGGYYPPGSKLHCIAFIFFIDMSAFEAIFLTSTSVDNKCTPILSLIVGFSTLRISLSTDSASFELGGKRVGIVGLGSIGVEVSKRLEAFGCSIAYSSRKEKPHVPYPYHANVLDLAAHSDALVLCCSLSEQTRHMINKDVMTALGKKGVVVNVGRGGLIDEKELVRFLLRGDIGGAGLDVFEDEPDVPRQLFELDNVVLSPHRAIFTPEAIEALNQLTFTNLKAFFSSKPLQSVYQIE
ncbi:GLYOXYLATE/HYDROXYPYRUVATE REDUCTASE HPR3 [Salix viminalis]|uniref:glyoxylate reductase (NADP(+)) n=1 Tax=Salix viminalis TaxID=40686 RepID=A0A9Q0TMZ8_SALVM|nr:GLYOXYLATE/HYDROXYPYRUVATE REDUCTASE HPR3 [Salix viminalis]